MTRPNAENFSLNVSYFYLDDVVAYDQTMRNNVMNTRIRMDFSTLWPELTNNDIRLCGNPTQAYGSHDNDENGGENGGFNYYIPVGYMKIVHSARIPFSSCNVLKCLGGIGAGMRLTFWERVTT